MEPSGLSGLPQLLEAIFMGTFWFPVYALLVFLLLSLSKLIEWKFVIVPTMLAVLPFFAFGGAFLLDSGFLYFSQLFCVLPALVSPLLWLVFRKRGIWSHIRILIALSAGQLISIILGYVSLLLQNSTDIPYTIVFLSVSVTGTTRHIFIFPFLLAALASYLLLGNLRKNKGRDFA